MFSISVKRHLLMLSKCEHMGDRDYALGISQGLYLFRDLFLHFLTISKETFQKSDPRQSRRLSIPG